jgi:hypothetical protein
MRILLPNRPGGAFGYITDGWMNALRSRGHTVSRYDGNESFWHDFQPDLYFGCSGHKQPIPKNRKAKVAIHVNPYGPINMGDINESQQSIDWTIAQKPDAVYGYGFETDKLAWSYWEEKAKIPWIPMPTAADAVLFNQINDLTNRKHDAVYLGGRWSYKGITIDKYLKPIYDDASIDLQIHGWGDWWPNACKGILPEDKANIFFNSGKVAPCISERHTQQYGIDIPERCWKVVLCGLLAIHDAVAILRDHFRTCVVSTDPSCMLDLVKYYLNHDEERIDLVEKQKQEVLTKHTYHHRLAYFFDAIGMQEAAKTMLNN